MSSPSRGDAGLERMRSIVDSALPGVPLVMDLVKTEEQRGALRVVFARQVIGRPFLAPPGVPKAR